MRRTSSGCVAMPDGGAVPARSADTRPARRRPRHSIRLALHRLDRLTLRRVAYSVATIWFNGLFYRRTLGGRYGRGLVHAPQEVWLGDARRGSAVLKKEYVFAGHAETEPPNPWRHKGAPEAWQTALHGFDWLRDLRAVGGKAAREHGRAMIVDWLEREDRWHPLSWRPDVIAERLTNWLMAAEYFYPVDEPLDAKPFLGSLIRQSRHLGRVIGLLDPGTDRLRVLCALVLTGVCMPAQARSLPRWLDMLSAESVAQVGTDGVHVTRSPAMQLLILRRLVELNGVLRDAGIDMPQPVESAIARMAAALRLLRHGDGRLCLFNDSDEEENWLIDLVLSRADARGYPVDAPPEEAGFQRLSANRTIVLMDAGPPPPAGFDRHAHAGALSFEMSVGRQRMIVNCGAYSGLREDWRLAQRATAAHSTVTIDDYNSADVLHGEMIGFRPGISLVDRHEADGNLWLDATIHDYGGIKGLSHQRRLYLTANGVNLRGEDCLSGKRQHRFIARFHLHPSVTASLAQNEESVLLRLRDGDGWRFRAEGGVVGLQESVYLGFRGRPRRTQQIVITGAKRSGTATLKWAFVRLGG